MLLDLPAVSLNIQRSFGIFLNNHTQTSYEHCINTPIAQKVAARLCQLQKKTSQGLTCEIYRKAKGTHLTLTYIATRPAQDVLTA